MSQFLRHEACEVCGSSDAKAIYDDGGTYCFSCKSHKGSKISGFVRESMETVKPDVIQLPYDLSNEYSPEAIAWVASYGLRVDELISHGVKFSKHYNQLLYIFPKIDQSGVGIIQARNFNPGARKYFNQGEIRNVLPIFKYSTKDKQALVIVEDCISAMKVSRVFDAMPLLGSSLMLSKVPQIKRAGYLRVVVWLDHDKYKESVGIATKFQMLGINTHCICTDMDPKCYSMEQIKEKLNVMKDC